MTTVSDPNHPGMYQVLFNGTTLACFHDTDCPGAGLCAINQTWSALPGGWCMCNTRAGLNGDTCVNICELGTARLVIGLIVIIMSVCITSIGCMACFSSIRMRQRVADNLNVLNTLLSSLTLGSILIVAYIITILVSTLGFPEFYEITFVQGRYLRRSPQDQDYAAFILLVLGQCVSVNAPLLLPLVWIDLTNTVFRFKKRSIAAIKLLSVAFCCLVCFVQFPLYVLAANNYQGQVAYFGQIAAIIWYVVYGFLILVNLTAVVNVLLVRRELKKRPRSEVTDRFHALLNRVLITATLLMVIFAILIGLIAGAQARQRRTIYSDPTCNVVGGSLVTQSDVCLRFALVFIEAGSGTCLWFIFPDTKRLIRSTSRTTNEGQGNQPRITPNQEKNVSPPALGNTASPVNRRDLEDPYVNTDSHSGFSPDNKQDIMVI